MQYLDFSHFLLKHTEQFSFDDLCNCRMAAYISQNGCCYVTGQSLKFSERELHHRLPKFHGGKDILENTIVLDKRVHNLLHSADMDEITFYMSILKLSNKQVDLLNQLRYEAFLPLLNHRNLIEAA